MKQLRTDLALEAFEGSGEQSMPGVHVNHWNASDVHMTEVIITDEQTAKQLGKVCGSYLTMECELLQERDPEARVTMANLLGEELGRMLKPSNETPILVVGLGNRSITPDSLGPKTIDKTLVTRHMMSDESFKAHMRNVCAIAPGVLGITGIETVEMVKSLIEKVQPSAVVCIDSLAARDSRRIGNTIQLTDTGIQPGAGVGNHRKALTKETLGIDVVAIGMPTVVYAATLARDAFAVLAAKNGQSECDDALENMEHELFGEVIGEMIVTPREIDSLIQDAAGIIASGLNQALQPDLSESEISAMMD